MSAPADRGMSTHSPQPWSRTGSWINAADGAQVAVVTYGRDVKLIRAAPELLEAVDRLISPQPSNADYEFAHEVLYRARGEL